MAPTTRRSSRLTGVDSGAVTPSKDEMMIDSVIPAKKLAFVKKAATITKTGPARKKAAIKKATASKKAVPTKEKAISKNTTTTNTTSTTTTSNKDNSDDEAESEYFGTRDILEDVVVFGQTMEEHIQMDHVIRLEGEGVERFGLFVNLLLSLPVTIVDHRRIPSLFYLTQRMMAFPEGNDLHYLQIFEVLSELLVALVSLGQWHRNSYEEQVGKSRLDPERDWLKRAEMIVNLIVLLRRAT